MNITNFIKKCPSCNNDIFYRDNKALKQSIKLNSRCLPCGQKSAGLKSSKTLKLRYKNGSLIPNMSGTQTKESRLKISKALSGRKQSKESNIKRSKTCIKSRCGHSNKGRKWSDEHKDLFRKYFLDRLSKTRLNFHPSFNKKACIYFDYLMIKNKIYIQHALNGGEYRVDSLHYFVDGYDKENNVVYEWDERRHFDKNGNLLEKDKIRQERIEDFLKCTTIRFNESLMVNSEDYHEFELFMKDHIYNE